MGYLHMLNGHRLRFTETCAVTVVRDVATVSVCCVSVFVCLCCVCVFVCVCACMCVSCVCARACALTCVCACVCVCVTYSPHTPACRIVCDDLICLNTACCSDFSINITPQG